MAYNTGRTGFATRGGTMREHLQIQINHQRYQMLAALQCLLDEIGVDEYNIWVDEVIGDDTPASEIIRIARAYLDDLVTCTCPPDATQDCPACLRYHEQQAAEGLPF